MVIARAALAVPERQTAAMTTFDDAEALLGAVGTDLGTSAWVEVGQERIAAFADATEDHQWIHLDESRAAAGPFGTTIAHGFLTLSLLVPMIGDLITFEQPTLVVNAGLDRVRFLSPVPSGGRVRARATLSAAERTRTGIRTTTDVTVELEGAERPALVAVSLLVHAPAPA